MRGRAIPRMAPNFSSFIDPGTRYRQSPVETYPSESIPVNGFSGPSAYFLMISFRSGLFWPGCFGLLYELKTNANGRRQPHVHGEPGYTHIFVIAILLSHVPDHA